MKFAFCYLRLKKQASGVKKEQLLNESLSDFTLTEYYANCYAGGSLAEGCIQ